MYPSKDEASKIEISKAHDSRAEYLKKQYEVG